MKIIDLGTTKVVAEGDDYCFLIFHTPKGKVAVGSYCSEREANYDLGYIVNKYPELKGLSFDIVLATEESDVQSEM